MMVVYVYDIYIEDRLLITKFVNNYNTQIHLFFHKLFSHEV